MDLYVQTLYKRSDFISHMC